MGCRARSWQVGGGTFAWHRGGWRRGRARAQWVGMVGLVHCVEVARFSCSGLGSWWGLHAVAGLVCGGLAMWQDLRTMLGWHRGEVFMGQVGIEVGLARCVGTVLEQCRGETCAL